MTLGPLPIDEHRETVDRRDDGIADRRARSRGGRRNDDMRRPWYRRRRWWLAAASVAFVAWRRVRNRL